MKERERKQVSERESETKEAAIGTQAQADGLTFESPGWFHKPIEGEEGYEGVEAIAPKSSLQQLVCSAFTPFL